jgi:hypothetical protein
MRIQNKLLCLFGITFIIGCGEYSPMQKTCAPYFLRAVGYISCIYLAHIAMLYNIYEKKSLFYRDVGNADV